jgi:hypothetical protein
MGLGCVWKILPEVKIADFGFWTMVLFGVISGYIARKRQAGQVPKDAFSTR